MTVCSGVVDLYMSSVIAERSGVARGVVGEDIEVVL